jgi:ubiquinone/menaquinone biosynthesis C-methylase UbiE/uncharacterized protein YbaR (Trm112 family)
MEKLKFLSKIKEIYSQNQNIIQYLKNTKNNSTEDILISYDFQAGSYIEAFKNNPDNKMMYCYHLANIINELGKFDSILEAGVGEATTFGNVLLSLRELPKKMYGFDLSWSRIKYAKIFLRSLDIINNIKLFTGDLFCAPIKDNSIDIVYTSHSIEPNGGREKEALKELYRITRKYLILLEPSFELSSDDAKNRMLEHGYITDLYGSVISLGYKVIEHRLFDISANPLNPTGLIIIKKEYDNDDHNTSDSLCCPITKGTLLKKDNVYYSPDSLLMYPIISEIPCLLPTNAIIATHFLDQIIDPSPVMQEMQM